MSVCDSSMCKQVCVCVCFHVGHPTRNGRQREEDQAMEGMRRRHSHGWEGTTGTRCALHRPCTTTAHRCSQSERRGGLLLTWVPPLPPAPAVGRWNGRLVQCPTCPPLLRLPLALGRWLTLRLVQPPCLRRRRLPNQEERLKLLLLLLPVSHQLPTDRECSHRAPMQAQRLLRMQRPQLVQRCRLGWAPGGRKATGQSGVVDRYE
jgi:hypothetical protein